MSKQTQDQIKRVCDDVKELLLLKNAKYGDSALHPQRVFSDADAIEQIKVRIDDKLSRIATTGFSAADEDTLQDLIGYLVLLKIALSRHAMGRQEKSNPYAVPYEDVLEDYAACPYDYSHYYGQKQDLDEAWGDFWEKTPDYISGWDDSLGPIEIEPEEIQERLAKKDLDQFAEDEIVSTIERRGMIIGFRKDGSSCLLKDGRCE